MNLREWAEKYKPLKTKDGEPFAFETYGGSVDFVKYQDQHHIWTLCDSDFSDKGYLIMGYHFINRLNYFVCEIPWDEADWCSISLDEDDDIDIYFSF